MNCNTVNSEILFNEKFCENKTFTKSLLLFTDIGKSCPSRKFVTLELYLLMIVAKILVKNSEFTVYNLVCMKPLQYVKFSALCISDICGNGEVER